MAAQEGNTEMPRKSIWRKEGELQIQLGKLEAAALVRDKWSVACVALGVTRNLSHDDTLNSSLKVEITEV